MAAVSDIKHSTLSVPYVNEMLIGKATTENEASLYWFAIPNDILSDDF